MASYGQFCPVAKTMELLDERWTVLVIRELLAGSTHFNELRRGNPKMSPALLSKRLRTLERAGVIDRMVDDGRSRYVLTEAGQELRPAVDALAVWGLRWIGQLGEEDLDPHLLMWDMKRTISLQAWSRRRTVVLMQFDDVAGPVARWWVCANGDELDICDFDPGFEVDATIRTSLRVMTEIWRVDLSWPQALRCEAVELSGPQELRTALPQMIGHMAAAAGVSRPQDPALRI